VTDDQKTAPKKRRTVAELRAHHTAELARLAAIEKAAAHKLVADAHDTLDEAAQLTAMAAHKPTMNQLLNACKAVIAALEKP
jgi:chemotaxis regulatin CheY-phosphate phosphatase CheZ